jgi:hypothetical protein
MILLRSDSFDGESLRGLLRSQRIGTGRGPLRVFRGRVLSERRMQHTWTIVSFWTSHHMFQSESNPFKHAIRFERAMCSAILVAVLTAVLMLCRVRSFLCYAFQGRQ